MSNEEVVEYLKFQDNFIFYEGCLHTFMSYITPV